MGKNLGLIALEIFLVAAVGFLINIATVGANINTAYVWIVLIVLLLILIITTWFRIQTENGTPTSLSRWKLTLPDDFTISISRVSIKKNFRFLFALGINSAIFGWFVANASFFAVQSLVDLPYSIYFIGVTAYSFELLGVIIIAFASVVAWRRISRFGGLLFSVASTVSFSLIHMTLLQGQPFAFTLFGNIIASVTLTILGVYTSPYFQQFVKLVLDFWNSGDK